MTAEPKRILRPGKLTTIVERRRRSSWAGHREITVPRLLPYRFGDGKTLVNLSFYDVPELEIVVPFDSRFPLDLDLEEWCKESETVRCFRDALDSIYELCREYFSDVPLTPNRRKQLSEEIELEGGERELWDLIIENGSTWSYFWP